MPAAFRIAMSGSSAAALCPSATIGDGPSRTPLRHQGSTFNGCVNNPGSKPSAFVHVIQGKVGPPVEGPDRMDTLPVPLALERGDQSPASGTIFGFRCLADARAMSGCGERSGSAAGSQPHARQDLRSFRSAC